MSSAVKHVARRDLIVMGASAGGVEALSAAVAKLPEDLPAAVLVVLHLPAGAVSVLPRILGRAGPLPAAHAVTGDLIQPGRIYVAPPDHHLLVSDGKLTLSRGPHENGHRPAIDPLFRSAAQARGAGVIGVVLSGTRDDGAAGLWAIARQGGFTVVQDPDDALHPSMPRRAMERVRADHVVPASEIGAVLSLVAGQDVAGETIDDHILEDETRMAANDPLTAPEIPLAPSTFGCPSCNGVLFELREDGYVRYRCRVGHAWSGDSLAAEQDGALETALWIALRTLEEKRDLTGRLAASAESRGHRHSANRHRAISEDAAMAGRLIREMIERAAGQQHLADDETSA